MAGVARENHLTTNLVRRDIQADIGREPRALFLAWLAFGMWFGAFAGLATGIAESGGVVKPKQRIVIASIAAMIIPVALMIFRASRRRRSLRLGADGLAMVSKGESFSIPLEQIHRLSSFQISSISRAVVIENKDGVQKRILILGKNRTEDLAELLNELEVRTGIPWVGRTPPATFRSFVAALRTASGSTSRGDFIRWLLRRAFVIQFEDAGVSDPIMQWSLRLFQFKALTSFALLMYFETSPDLTMLVRLAMIGVVVIDWMFTCLGINILVTLMRGHIRGKELLEAELNAAREVQQRLLPKRNPLLALFEVAGSCLPAANVGGDYYDFIVTPSGSMAIAVADVSGKGLPAGLLMTLTKGALNTSIAAGDDIAGVLSRLNRAIKISSEERMFVSMVLVTLEASGRTVTVGRAGHNPPLLVRGSGESFWLRPPGIALGLDEGRIFDRMLATQEIELAADDVLVLYTDGVTEAMNAISDEYGEERLESIVREHRTSTAAELSSIILDDVRFFRGVAAVNDDLTLVVLRGRGA